MVSKNIVEKTEPFFSLLTVFSRERKERKIYFPYYFIISFFHICVQHAKFKCRKTWRVFEWLVMNDGTEIFFKHFEYT